MEHTYFSDQKYRILLQAMYRERKICKHIDKESGSKEPVCKLTSVMNGIETKVRHIQYHYYDTDISIEPIAPKAVIPKSNAFFESNERRMDEKTVRAIMDEFVRDKSSYMDIIQRSKDKSEDVKQNYMDRVTSINCSLEKYRSLHVKTASMCLM